MTRSIDSPSKRKPGPSKAALRHLRTVRWLPCILVGFGLATLSTNAIPTLSAEQPTNPDAPEPALNALEEKLVATLEEATFIGRWHPVVNGRVGAENNDQYSIAGAEKIDGNRWIIRARLRPEMPNLIIPVPLRIEWAGDTPVLIVDNFGLPGMNRYSARVLIYEDTYAGTWSGGGMAGLISGVIVREPDEPEVDEQSLVPLPVN